jgi:hypothetical protein
MMRVLKPNIVAQALHRLRSARIHPLFAGYLHLQKRSRELGRSTDLEPQFVEFYRRHFYVKDHPVGAPYIKPFTHQRASERNLWLNENVAGSYAPRSLRAGQPFRQVVDVDVEEGRYSLSPDHAAKAREHLLYDERVPVGELATFLYRDFGITDASTSLEHLVDKFALDFGYADQLGGRRSKEFSTLYVGEAKVAGTEPFEAFAIQEESYSEAQIHGIPIGLTEHHVRELTADDVLVLPDSTRVEKPSLKVLRIAGLLSFGDESVFEFGRLNVLVGPNGSGKSNLIDCIRALRGASGDIQRVFRETGGIEEWLYNGLEKDAARGILHAVVQVAQLPQLIRHELVLRSGPNARMDLEELVGGMDPTHANTELYFAGSYRSHATLWGTGGGKRRRERVLRGSEYDPSQSILSQIKDVAQYPEVTRLATLYSDFRIYSEWTFGRDSKLREPARPDRSDTRLSERMDDLPAVLNLLTQTPAHEHIKRRKRTVTTLRVCCLEE